MNFDILKCLLPCLDDKRNDIFIHFDYKLTQIEITDRSMLIYLY